MSPGIITAATLLCATTLLPLSALALEQPDCALLEPWAAGFATADTLTLAPKVNLSAQLGDDKTVPLFGAPVTEWTGVDFNAVKNLLNKCRKPALKRGDKAAAKQLYEARSMVGKGLGPLNKLRQYRGLTAESVDNIVNYHRVPELPQIIALAQRALTGEDVVAELRGISIGRSFQDHMRRLQQAHDYLPASELEVLTAKLAAAEESVAAEQSAVNKEFEAAKQQLAAVPMTQAGVMELDRLNQLPVLSKVPRDQALAFQGEVMKKRQAISNALRQQATQQAAAEAAKPVPIEARLNTLLGTEDDVEDASIRGLRPGIPYAKAKRMMASDWGFGTGAGGDILFKQYAPTGRDLDRYKKQERRDGGMFLFETMEDEVGKLGYTEHYTGALDIGAIQNWLIGHFGKPDTQHSTPVRFTWNWEEDGIHLQIVASNQALDQMRAMWGFKSALEITLWSDDYTDFLAAAQKHCQELMKKPTSDLSAQDKMDLLQGCKKEW